MKKKKTANIVMVAVIIAIAVSGILGVGHIKGWFDKSDDNTALLTDYRGIITMQRDGVAYTTSEDTLLRDGDKITCDPGATVKISLSNGYITLGQNADIEIINPKISEFAIRIVKGEAFVDANNSVLFEFDGKQSEISNAVVSLSVHKGAQNICVYYGTVENAKSGQMLEWIGNELSVRDFSINSLNEFIISQMRKVEKSKVLVFSDEELDKLEADRWAQMNKPEETLPTLETETTETTKTNETTVKSTNSATKEKDSPATVESSTKSTPKETTKEKTTKKSEPAKTETTTKRVKPTKPAETAKPEVTTKPVETTEAETTAKKLTCTITIRCDTILDNMDELDPAKAPYVPDDGVILREVTVEFTEGETVFDVLNRACKQYNIPLEYSWTPMYDSYYVEGINNLYEFDCGVESGWMYKVNGWFPNYGCSSYYLTGGESIVWCYTCKGLGEDIGAERWE